MTIRKSYIFYLALVLICFSCKNKKQDLPVEKDLRETFVTPLGKKIDPTLPSQKMLTQYEKAKEDFLKNPDIVDNIIWYGRRTAYLGNYEAAIKIYSEGIKQHPEDARLYRHRGHRYISMRKFDEAIADLEQAVRLIKGKENKIEPDGMPNAQNIPISSLHGNIWYHLGLAYYLKDDMEQAYKAYLNCRNVTANDDNVVSSTHWLYMIRRRMQDSILAEKLLEPVNDTMTIIENFSYYKLCKFYKGTLPADSLHSDGAGPANDAVRYGLANWHFYNGDREKAKILMKTILDGTSWNSFGYIAAESDYLRYFKD